MRSQTVLLAVALLAGLTFATAGRTDDVAHWFQGPDGKLIGGPTKKWTPPSFCYKKDCPEYTVKETADDVELRAYSKAHWINTNVTDSKFDDAFKEGSKRLDGYFSGDNDKGTKVDDTLPNLVLLYPAPTGRTFNSRFTIEYFVPFSLQDSPPEPSKEEVGIIAVPMQEVWVKTFGGYASESDVTNQAFDFLDYLQKQGKKVSRASIGFAQYDPITTVINRHNEIWIWPEQQPSANPL